MIKSEYYNSSIVAMIPKQQEDLQWLREKILEFMTIIENCLASTNYANDRPIYTSDLAMASKWLIKLYKNESIADICSEILSAETGKYFGDYWRQGPWSDNEAEALKSLREQITKRFNSH